MIINKNKKTIAIDGNEANVKNRVGVNMYAFEILKNLSLLQDDWKGEYEIKVYLKDTPLPDMPPEGTNWTYVILDSVKPFWVLTRLMPYLMKLKEKPVLFFSPSHYTIPFATFPRIVSIMDLGYLNNSDHFKKITFWQLKYWTAISLFVSKYIIAISEATKKDIVRHYPFTRNKIAVTLLAHDNAVFNENIDQNDVRRIKDKYSIVDDYILYLGTLKPSKNIEGIVKGFSLLKDKNIQLVVAGKKGWLYDKIFETVKTLGIEKRVIFTDYFPESDKKALFHGAKLLVSPSYWEGFGLHVLEAMACGVPVVTSRAGSLPEIVGSAGIVVNTDPESIALGMEKILSMKEIEYNKLSQACLDQAGRFDWKKTAEETLTVFRKVINKDVQR